MRKKFFFLPLFAALALTGCQSDEPGPNGGETNQKCGYVAVNIIQPSSVPGSKAAEGFEYGSDQENNAATGTFFIFNSDNQLTQDAQTLDLNGYGTATAPDPEIERIYNAVLVIEGETTEPTAAKIVCVLNAPDPLKNITKPTEGTTPFTISDLEEYIGNYKGQLGSFIMSNSVYMDGDPSAKVLAAEVTKIAKSEAEALKNPVEIYVERTVAKVVATSDATDGITDNKANPAISGVETTLDIKITGIEVANIATTSYLFKNIGAGYADFTWAWNDATNKRSYWETVSADLIYDNQSYNAIAGHKGTTDDPYQFISKGINFTDYIQPNTSDNQKTAILVTAQLYQNNAPFTNLAYIRGGYTTTDEAKKVVATYLAKQGYYKQDPTNTSHFIQLDENDLIWKNNQDFKNANQAIVEGLKDYEVVAQIATQADLTEGQTAITKVYNQAGEEIAGGIDDINALLKSNEATPATYRARVYTDGLCYYYVAIDHSSVGGLTAGTLTGVVRNHIYKLTLESIAGIGTPVFDPEDVIIPDKPTDEESFYLAARVNVLAWKLATQTVNFEGN